MWGFDEGREQRDNVYEGRHEGKLSHELLGGAAGFEAMKLFEDQQRKQGKPVEHAFAKELIAGIAASQVDRLIETKGLDFLDAEKAKHHAKKQAEHLYEEQYSQYDQYNPDEQPRHRHHDY